MRRYHHKMPRGLRKISSTPLVMRYFCSAESERQAINRDQYHMEDEAHVQDDDQDDDQDNDQTNLGDEVLLFSRAESEERGEGGEGETAPNLIIIVMPDNDDDDH